VTLTVSLTGDAEGTVWTDDLQMVCGLEAGTTSGVCNVSPVLGSTVRLRAFSRTGLHTFSGCDAAGEGNPWSSDFPAYCDVIMTSSRTVAVALTAPAPHLITVNASGSVPASIEIREAGSGEAPVACGPGQTPCAGQFAEGWPTVVYAYHNGATTTWTGCAFTSTTAAADLCFVMPSTSNVTVTVD